MLFMIKALATYGHSVLLSRIGNRIIALNQRRMFNALINQNVAFFAERHSSEFLARLTTGATSATQVINLLVSALGRDLLSLIGLLIVMVVQDPVHVASDIRGGAAGIRPAAQADPPHLRHRAQPVPRRHAHPGDHAGDGAGHPHRQGLHARRCDAGTARRQRRRARSRIRTSMHEWPAARAR